MFVGNRALSRRCRRSLANTLSLFGLCVLVTGCGGTPAAAPLHTMHPVKGKIRSELGSVAGATISFVANSPTAANASGVVKPDGSFELHTLLPNDGASDGDYKICFIKTTAAGRAAALPARFYNADDSGLTATIKPDTADLGTIIVGSPSGK